MKKWLCCGKSVKLHRTSDFCAHFVAGLIWGLRPQSCHRASEPMPYDGKVAVEARKKHQENPYQYQKPKSGCCKLFRSGDSAPLRGKPKVINQEVDNLQDPLQEPLSPRGVNVTLDQSERVETKRGPKASEGSTDDPSSSSDERHERVDSSNGGKKWPLIIFSHGVQGSCSMYVNLAMQLASAGYVVISIEHADGSGLWSRDEHGKDVEYQPPPRMESGYYGCYMEDWREKNVHERREVHLAHRQREWVNLFDKIGDDEFVDGDHDNPHDQKFARLLQSCDRSNVILAGHSFGASTILQLLSNEYVPAPSHPKIKAALLIDLFSRARKWDNLTMKQDVDVLLVQSEMFTSIDMFGRTMVPKLQQIIPMLNQDRFRKSWIRKMSHIGYADFGLMTVMGEHNKNVHIFSAFIVEYVQCLANGGCLGPFSEDDLVRFGGEVEVDFPDPDGETRDERIAREEREAKEKNGPGEEESGRKSGTQRNGIG